MTGDNLNKKTVRIPQDLKGELNLLIMPFQRWHQSLVDGWVWEIKQFFEKNPEIAFYEIPTLSKMYRIARWMIDGGMRAGIANYETQERTITVYIDKGDLKRHLRIPNEDTIFLFLVDRNGQIYWRGEGPFNDNDWDQLKEVIERELNSPGKKGVELFS